MHALHRQSASDGWQQIELSGDLIARGRLLDDVMGKRYSASRHGGDRSAIYRYDIAKKQVGDVLRSTLA